MRIKNDLHAVNDEGESAVQMTKATVMSELQRVVPRFRVDSDYLNDQLTYPVFNDFARFICSEAEVLCFANKEDDASRMSQVEVSMAFLE